MLQTAENDLSQLFVNGVVVVHVEPVVPRVVNQRLVIGVLVNITFDERRVAFGQDIEHHSQRKDIGSLGIVEGRAHDLRTHVALGPKNSLALLALVKDGSKAEVRQLDFEILVYRNVVRLDVAVRDIVLVQVLER